MPLEKQIQNTLNSTFNLENFRPLQEEIITTVMRKENTLGILQTSAGKSLTYQLPSQMLPGLTIVISPLISLMQDQVKQLSDMGIESGSINSMTEDFEKHEILNKIYNNEMKIIFLSPEKLIEQKFLEWMLKKGVEVSLIVIDEAHCISQWGKGFRSSYQELEKLKFDYNDIPILLLTATATKKIIEDIKHKFIIDDAHVFIGSFLKENLDYEIVFKKNNPEKQVWKIIKTHKNQKGIIYCNTRKEVETLNEYLRESGVKSEMYHAGLPNNVREKSQELYTNDEIDVMVATTAFGMGVNVPDIRFVIHYNTPYSVENYYQETGRAGRDRKESKCYLLFSPKDVSKTKYYLTQNSEDGDALQKFNRMIRYVMSVKCRKKALLSYFNEEADFENCGMCDICKRKEEQYKVPNSDKIARTIIETVEKDCHNERSIGTVRDILLGSGLKKIKEGYKKSRNYAKFKGLYSKEMVEYFIYNLIIDDILQIDVRRGDNYSWEVVGANFEKKHLEDDYAISQPLFEI